MFDVAYFQMNTTTAKDLVETNCKRPQISQEAPPLQCLSVLEKPIFKVQTEVEVGTPTFCREIFPCLDPRISLLARARSNQQPVVKGLSIVDATLLCNRK